MRYSHYFTILLLFLTLNTWAHPVHVSVTTIEYQPEKKGFVVAFKIFYEDLSSVLTSINKSKVVVGNEDNKWQNLAEKYISETFSLEVNGKAVGSKMKYVIHEINHEAVWLYYAVTFRGNGIKSVKVRNQILSDFFSNQTNLVIIKTPGTEKGFSLSGKETECEVLL